MAIDIYGTGALKKVVETMRRPQLFLLNTFFTEVETSDSETIYFDVDGDEKLHLAPYVHPMVEGKVVETAGYSTKSFVPPYVKYKLPLPAVGAFRRSAGESIGTGQELNPAQRQEKNLKKALVKLSNMLSRRFEFQAAEALRAGTATVVSERPDGTSETNVINYGRDASLQITKAGGTKWGESGVKPLDDLEAWAELVGEVSGATVKKILMEPSAWRALKANADFEKRLDLKRVVSGDFTLGVAPTAAGAQYKGTDGTFEYWVYNQKFYDRGTSQNVALLDTGRVIGVADSMDDDNRFIGVRHFGAIKDEDAGFQAVEYFPKSWTIPDPSVRFVMVQSAPLMVPYRINASFSAKVL
jgi:hypothetical protein